MEYLRSQTELQIIIKDIFRNTLTFIMLHVSSSTDEVQWSWVRLLIRKPSNLAKCFRGFLQYLQEYSGIAP
jgi:hypothetical protein